MAKFRQRLCLVPLQKKIGNSSTFFSKEMLLNSRVQKFFASLYYVK